MISSIKINTWGVVGETSCIQFHRLRQNKMYFLSFHWSVLPVTHIAHERQHHLHSFLSPKLELQNEVKCESHSGEDQRKHIQPNCILNFFESDYRKFKNLYKQSKINKKTGQALFTIENSTHEPDKKLQFSITIDKAKS